MHKLVKNEKKKERRARPLLQTRTGPTALSDSVSLTDEKKQQKRIAARAATAMAQVLHRRREPRSHLMWGDRKKVRRKFYFFFISFIGHSLVLFYRYKCFSKHVQIGQK